MSVGEGFDDVINFDGTDTLDEHLANRFIQLRLTLLVSPKELSAKSSAGSRHWQVFDFTNRC